jgi:hypothetical protein
VFVATERHRGGSLEHQSVDVDEHLIDTLESVDVCVPL